MKDVRHTTVIGIMGALGKTNLTSSNLLRRRQFWARPTLDVVEQSDSSYTSGNVESRLIPACSTNARVSINVEIALCKRLKHTYHLDHAP